MKIINGKNVFIFNFLHVFSELTIFGRLVGNLNNFVGVIYIFLKFFCRASPCSF